MTNEPNYEYVKGQGWVVSCTGFYYKDASGKTVLAERRMPKMREYYYKNPAGLSGQDLINKLKTSSYEGWQRRGNTSDDWYKRTTPDAYVLTLVE